MGVGDLGWLQELRELGAVAAGAVNGQVAHVHVEAMLGMHLHPQLVGNALADAL